MWTLSSVLVALYAAALVVIGLGGGLYIVSRRAPDPRLTVPDDRDGPADDDSAVGWFELDPPTGARPAPAPETNRPAHVGTAIHAGLLRHVPAIHSSIPTGVENASRSLPLRTIPVPDPSTPGDQSMIDKGELDMVNKGTHNVTSGDSGLKIHKSVDQLPESEMINLDDPGPDPMIEKSPGGTQVQGRGAHLRATREYLGLPVRWLAAHLRVRERTLERWEDDQSDIPAGVFSELDELEHKTLDVEDGLLNWLTENPTMDVIGTFRTDLDIISAQPDCPYPASWHRALVGRVVRDAERFALTVRYVDVTKIDN